MDRRHPVRRCVNTPTYGSVNNEHICATAYIDNVIPHISKCVNEECAFSTFDAKRTLHALYKMDNAACGRTAFAFGAYTNDCEYWRKILEASAMYKSFSAAFYVTACIINQEGST